METDRVILTENGKRRTENRKYIFRLPPPDIRIPTSVFRSPAGDFVDVFVFIESNFINPNFAFLAGGGFGTYAV